MNAMPEFDERYANQACLNLAVEFLPQTVPLSEVIRVKTDLFNVLWGAHIRNTPPQVEESRP